jgi:hypothetical protein
VKTTRSNMTTESFINHLKELPSVLFEQVRMYAWEDPVKDELQTFFDRKETSAAWKEVSDAWVEYCEEIEAWSMIWGNSLSIKDAGLSKVYLDHQDVRMSEEESWYREIPLRDAKGRNEKKATIRHILDWDEIAVDISQSMLW